jgi:putative RecB family exonuclease
MKIIKAKKTSKSAIEERQELLQVVIEEIEKPRKNFSASKIDLFKSCPLKYKFKYVDKIEKKEENAPSLTMGITYHKAMEYIYFCIANKIKIDLDMCDKIVDEELDRSMCSYMSDIEWNEFVSKLKMIVRKYTNRRNKQTPLVIDGNIMSEVEFNVPMINPLTNEKLDNVYLIGFMDMIDENYKIIDFKTSSKAYSQDKVDTAMQMTVYSYAFRQMFNITESALEFDVAIKREASKSNPNGEPEFKNYTTFRTLNSHNVLFNTIKAIIKSEESGVFYPAYPGEGSFCKNCVYKTECESWCG